MRDDIDAVPALDARDPHPEPCPLFDPADLAIVIMLVSVLGALVLGVL